jgi:uncharacterized protein (TIGR02246 family)
MTTIDHTATATTDTALAARLLEQLELAWNNSDGAAFGDAFHDDGEFVDVRGGYHRGVKAIADGHQGLFESVFAGSTIRYRLETARTVAPGCVIAVAGATLVTPGGPMQGTHRSRLTAAITDSDAGWAIAAFHNTLVREEN